MQQLPQKLPYDLMQTQWASIINPVLKNPIVNGVLSQQIKLTTGNNIVNHKLGRNLTGWYITRMRGSFVQVYDTQDSNQSPELTLLLNSSGNCTIDLFCF